MSRKKHISINLDSQINLAFPEIFADLILTEEKLNNKKETTKKSLSDYAVNPNIITKNLLDEEEVSFPV